MLSTRWWWIRHAPVPQLADCIYGNTDPDCDTGDSAAYRSLCRRLPRGAVWVVSALKRTHQTARAVGRAGYALPPLLVEPDFGEQDMGALHGTLHVTNSARRSDPYDGFWPLDPERSAPVGESLADVRARVVRGLRRLEPRYRGRDIVCVAHGGPILAAVSHVLSLELRSAVQLSIPNLSLTLLEQLASPQLGGPAWRVRCIGERANAG
jgi:broad specificity phosphatase PhoE